MIMLIIIVRIIIIIIIRWYGEPMSSPVAQRKSIRPLRPAQSFLENLRLAWSFLDIKKVGDRHPALGASVKQFDSYELLESHVSAVHS